MSVYLQDADVTIHQGDVLDELRQLPDESVHMCCTSPPFYGLRDYGTGEWEGGRVPEPERCPACDGEGTDGREGSLSEAGLPTGSPEPEGEAPVSLSHPCGMCGGAGEIVTPCDHTAPKQPGRKFTNGRGEGQGDNYAGSNLKSWTDRDGTTYRDVCGKCGARRVDQQIGLEQTPDEYVARLVEVFREVRRVLRDDGTCWIELGDSYAGSWGNQGRKPERGTQRPINGGMLTPVLDGRYPETGSNTGAIPEGADYKPKDLLGVPWMVAFALRADGWWLRSEIIWAKPNPLPESVTDRPTTSHSRVFLLTKSPRYFYDAEAIKEQASPNTHSRGNGTSPKMDIKAGETGAYAGWGESTKGHVDARNRRSVWTIPTQPYPEAHFATWPEKLVEPMILAGSPEGGTVLDPFAGSGTTCFVARKLGRRSIGIDLNPQYLALAARRLQQLSLFAQDGAEQADIPAPTSMSGTKNEQSVDHRKHGFNVRWKARQP